MVTLGELISIPVHNAGASAPFAHVFLASDFCTCPSFCCSGYHCLNFSGHLNQACLPTVSPTTRDMPHILPALQSDRALGEPRITLESPSHHSRNPCSFLLWRGAFICGSLMLTTIIFCLCGAWL